jgi:hypothetical protein
VDAPLVYVDAGIDLTGLEAPVFLDEEISS